MVDWKMWLCLWALMIAMFVVGGAFGASIVSKPEPCDCSKMREEIIESSTETCGILIETVANLKKKDLCPWESY